MPAPVLESSAPKTPRELFKIWETSFVGNPRPAGIEVGRSADGGRELNREPFRPLAKLAFNFGEIFLAHDIARAGARVLSELFANEPALVAPAVRWLDYWRALCLAEQGCLDEAGEILRALAAAEPGNGDFVAGRARVHKDAALRAPLAGDTRRAELQEAHQHYLAAARLDPAGPPDTFPLINAAATALWAGDTPTAHALADEVIGLIGPKPVEELGEWDVPTLAEARLIRGELEAAVAGYREQRRRAERKREWRSLHTARRQAREHLRVLGLDPAPVEAAFDFPPMVVFAGHMIDRRHARPPRFPPAREGEVRARVVAGLRALRPGFGICSAACGGDLIFIEEMLGLDPRPEVHVILPWREEDFIASSVEYLKDGYWTDKLVEILHGVTSVSFLSQQTEPRPDVSGYELGFEHLTRCINGLSLLRARTLGLAVHPLVLWDGEEGRPGGTGSFVRGWEELGRKVTDLPAPSPRGSASRSEPRARDAPAIPPGAATATAPSVKWIRLDPAAPGAARRKKTSARAKKATAGESLSLTAGRQTIKTMLFADVVGYSRMPESQLPLFTPHFLGLISRIIARGPEQPVITNTWGDAVYLVFDAPEEAGRFALRLAAAVTATDWKKLGLPADLNLRIALHTGPVLLCVDPIRRQVTITGSHVSHAARIEPKVKSGEVWASEAFAAQIALEEEKRRVRRRTRELGFTMDYLGQVELAKDYGRYPLFRVRKT